MTNTISALGLIETTTKWQLDPQLSQDTYAVLETEDYLLRLHKNACFPWFILVPKTSQHELFDCSADFQAQIGQQVAHYAKMLKSQSQANKINIAMLGNVVAQLHIHLIARYHDDAAWPNPVWGCTVSGEYSAQELSKRLQWLI